MLKTRNVQLLLLFGVVSALPACSGMMGNRTSGSASSSVAAAPQPVANDMVRQVQGRLQQDGYYKQGAVDGVWGTGTMNAVQAFQRDHNLSASGKLDVPTLQALNITDSGNNPAPTNPNPSTDARPYNTTPSTAPASNNPNRQP
jgi:peptidoglycan hydrolase-like protein with peptidoglycan-binding domain